MSLVPSPPRATSEVSHTYRMTLSDVLDLIAQDEALSNLTQLHYNLLRNPVESSRDIAERHKPSQVVEGSTNAPKKHSRAFLDFIDYSSIKYSLINDAKENALVKPVVIYTRSLTR
ncbi:hypothetical protein RND71_038349 [Anisodus tanguticus]|uniref:Uncharacterized protein n=1 Tax=Anisodus tanguticus TaxID=243964 RepID=A0AAE1US18_9SOLA|nr:hypothetical protein RND71_038349 [Anisodus tanguticus]